MNNLRFATILHILVLLHHRKNQITTSDFIAGSINVNPVVVRREIKFLKEAGILDAKKGKDGGSFLKKDGSEIKLNDIYQLIVSQENFGKMNHPNPKCLIGQQMNHHLTDLFEDIHQSIIQQLSHTTLEEFSNQFK